MPETWLIAKDISHGDRTVDKTRATHEFAIPVIGKEMQRAAGDPARLFIGHPVSGSSYTQAHCAEPYPHAATKLDIARARFHCFAL